MLVLLKTLEKVFLPRGRKIQLNSKRKQGNFLYVCLRKVNFGDSQNMLKCFLLCPQNTVEISIDGCCNHKSLRYEQSPAMCRFPLD